MCVWDTDNLLYNTGVTFYPLIQIDEKKKWDDCRTVWTRMAQNVNSQ